MWIFFFPLEFVDWLSKLSLIYLTPDSNYQRKKTVLLLLSAVLETCTDTWSPDRKKGQPPGNKTTLTKTYRGNIFLGMYGSTMVSFEVHLNTYCGILDLLPIIDL